MYENLKHAVIKHLTKKFKKYSHFQTITTNNRNQISYQTILTFSESFFQIKL